MQDLHLARVPAITIASRWHDSENLNYPPFCKVMKVSASRGAWSRAAYIQAMQRIAASCPSRLYSTAKPFIGPIVELRGAMDDGCAPYASSVTASCS